MLFQKFMSENDFYHIGALYKLCSFKIILFNISSIDSGRESLGILKSYVVCWTHEHYIVGRDTGFLFN